MSENRQRGFLSFFRGDSPPEPANYPERFYYEQIAAAVGAGGWTIDFTKKKSYFDKQLRTIFDTPPNYKPSLKHALNFYDEDYHELLAEVFEGLKNGVSREGEMKMRTYDGKTFWGRCIGKPIFNSKNKVTGIRGIILNIDEQKEHQLSLENSLEVIEANNNRLFKFANHISHNLKNHINNLELTTQLVNTDQLPEEQKELMANYAEIASSLSQTVEELNEVVSIQKKAKEKRETIDLQSVFEHCKSDLQQVIEEKNGYVYSDFSEAPEVEFNKGFFENIFCSLIKNGLKNEKPGRNPEIKAYSIEDNAETLVIIEDNGAGIEMEDHNEFVYYTYGAGEFKSRSQSIDLFIIKNQVEAMGSRLEIKSKPGYGTKFTIRL